MPRQRHALLTQCATHSCLGPAGNLLFSGTAPLARLSTQDSLIAQVTSCLPTCHTQLQAVETSVSKTKCCTKCKVSQPLTAYHKRTQSEDGLQTACKDCKKSWAAQLKESRKCRPHYTGALQCTTCKGLKPAKEFHLRIATVHGLQYECKACSSVRMRSLYLFRKGLHRPSVQHKVCRCCQAEQPSDQFYPNVAISDGLQSYCIPCMRSKLVQRQLKVKHTI